MIAVLSLLMSIGAAAVGVYALDVAREAKSASARSAPAEPVAAPSAPVGSVASPTPSLTSAPTGFRPEFVRSALNIPAASGCASVFVDVDTLKVGTDAGHEFYLSSCLGPQSIRIDRTSGAVPTADNPGPEVCAALLSGSATTELVLQPRAGLTFCLLTNKEDAASQGIPQRIGIVEVREVHPDQSLTVAVSAYRVPA